MKTRSLLPVFAIAVVLVIAVMIVAFQPAAANEKSTGNADTARWVAMGEYYTVLSGERPARAETADQARWDAMGSSYLVANGQRPLNAATADQARWDAMGEFFSQTGQ
ncbi:MAG: hypothetical protein WAM60_07140 [Candidatus Promineifilaceae bacterium]